MVFLPERIVTVALFKNPFALPTASIGTILGMLITAEKADPTSTERMINDMVAEAYRLPPADFQFAKDFARALHERLNP